MPRSPRSRRTKVKSSDKTQRSLSSCSRTPLPPSPGSISSVCTVNMEIATVEKAVSDYLAGDAFVDKLVAKLADKVRDAVVDTLSNSLREARELIDTLKKEVSELKTDLQHTQTKAEKKSDELEQYQRRNNLRIFGLPENQGESTDELVLKLVRSKLGVNLPLERVERSHRVGRPQTPGNNGQLRPRPIIVKFLSYRDRREVFSKKKNLKGSGVTIREDLTPLRAEILRRATQQHGQRKVWTVDGRVIWEDAGGTRRVATAIGDLEGC